MKNLVVVLEAKEDTFERLDWVNGSDCKLQSVIA
jgi:hypothetical protein